MPSVGLGGRTRAPSDGLGRRTRAPSIGLGGRSRAPSVGLGGWSRRTRAQSPATGSTNARTVALSQPLVSCFG